MPLWCDLGFFPNSRGNKAAANLRPMLFPSWPGSLRSQPKVAGISRHTVAGGGDRNPFLLCAKPARVLLLTASISRVGSSKIRKAVTLNSRTPFRDAPAVLSGKFAPSLDRTRVAKPRHESGHPMVGMAKRSVHLGQRPCAPPLRDALRACAGRLGYPRPPRHANQRRRFPCNCGGWVAAHFEPRPEPRGAIRCP